MCCKWSQIHSCRLSCAINDAGRGVQVYPRLYEFHPPSFVPPSLWWQDDGITNTISAVAIHDGDLENRGGGDDFSWYWKKGTRRHGQLQLANQGDNLISSCAFRLCQNSHGGGFRQGLEASRRGERDEGWKFEVYFILEKREQEEKDVVMKEVRKVWKPGQVTSHSLPHSSVTLFFMQIRDSFRSIDTFIPLFKTWMSCVHHGLLEFYILIMLALRRCNLDKWMFERIGFFLPYGNQKTAWDLIWG